MQHCIFAGVFHRHMFESYTMFKARVELAASQHTARWLQANGMQWRPDVRVDVDLNKAADATDASVRVWWEDNENG